jgi:predicted nucleotidyltransferase
MTLAPGITVPDAQLKEICHRYHIKELSLFGSTARGEHRPDSDLDLLVDYLPEAKVSYFDHFGAEEELTALFQKKVQLVAKDGLKERIRREILPDIRILYAA